MGNPFGKQVKDTGKSVRQKVFQAQDTFIHKLDEPTREVYEKHVDGDTDSIVPDNELPNLQKHRGTVIQIDARLLMVDIHKYEFPFENLVFEGGGVKGMAYCGAVRLFEELGLISIGAIAAALLGVGYDSYKIEEFFSVDFSKIFIDHKCGYLSLLPNLVQGFGWNPGKRVIKWLGQCIYDITGNADITFSEVYERYGTEICIVVTNLNMMNAEYFHPKTTPDMPVRVAVRMSMSIPGLFKASKYDNHGQQNIYVDGGLLCNYAINCFDGWWLSMKMEDSFLNRLQPIEECVKLFENKERFGEYNMKTLGLMVYADNELYILRDRLEERFGVELPELPKTKLAEERTKKKNIQEKARRKHELILHAVDAFLKVLQKHNTDKDDKISKEELQNALNDTEAFPQRYVERLFGKNVTVDEAMAAIDEDQDGEIYFHELIHFIERTGVSLQTRFLGYQRKEIKGLFSFFETLQVALLTNVMKISVEERDIDRTIGINTGHVGTADFVLDQEDKDFIVQQGMRSAEAYLRHYVIQNNPPLKEGCEPDFDPETRHHVTFTNCQADNSHDSKWVLQNKAEMSERRYNSDNNNMESGVINMSEKYDKVDSATQTDVVTILGSTTDASSQSSYIPVRISTKNKNVKFIDVHEDKPLNQSTAVSDKMMEQTPSAGSHHQIGHDLRKSVTIINITSR